MNTMKITDIYGKEDVVDISQKKLYLYSNKNNRAEWQAPIVKDGIHVMNVWVNYIVPERIDDIERRCESSESVVQIGYHIELNNRKDSDSDKRIWNKLIQYVTDHQEDFFDKYGDWLPDLQISEDMIRKWIK